MTERVDEWQLQGCREAKDALTSITGTMTFNEISAHYQSMASYVQYRRLNDLTQIRHFKYRKQPTGITFLVNRSVSG